MTPIGSGTLRSSKTAGMAARVRRCAHQLRTCRPVSPAEPGRTTAEIRAGGGVGQRDHGGFQDLGVGEQDVDLGGVDGDAADLDLEVGAAGEVDAALVVAGDEVPGAEPPPSGAGARAGW